MDAILSFAELERFANQKLKHYSSGMAARLGYAVAFEAVREVLVLDEVFAVGDAGFKAKCEERYPPTSRRRPRDRDGEPSPTGCLRLLQPRDFSSTAAGVSSKGRARMWRPPTCRQ
jgi:hypothetical protein